MVQAGNNVGAKGAGAIAEALKVNTSLETIYLVGFLFDLFLLRLMCTCCDLLSVRGNVCGTGQQQCRRQGHRGDYYSSRSQLHIAKFVPGEFFFSDVAII
jgi:hypothetical protein